jgi:AcrR family transcriptional regulator
VSKASVIRSATRPAEPAGQQRRDEIVQAAARLGARKPYAAISMDEIAENAGVTKPTVYAYFTSKEQIFIRVATDAMERFRSALVSRQNRRSAFTLLRDLVLRFAIARMSHNGGEALVLSEAVEVVRSPEYRAAQRELVSCLYDCVVAAQQAGSIRSDIQPESAVLLVLSFLRGLYPTSLSPNANPKQAALEATAVLFGGLTGHTRKRGLA